MSFLKIGNTFVDTHSIAAIRKTPDEILVILKAGNTIPIPSDLIEEEEIEQLLLFLKKNKWRGRNEQQ